MSFLSDHLCYLRVSDVYVHENCCLGVQRHPPTYMERGTFQDGPETMFQMGMSQMWYLVSVTEVTGDGATIKLVVTPRRRGQIR